MHLGYASYMTSQRPWHGIVTQGTTYMTSQEMFDRAWHGIVTQGAPSLGTGSTVPTPSQCLYSGPNGTHCAFWYVVPETLRPHLRERWPAKTLVETWRRTPDIPELAEWASSADPKLCRDIQLAHDHAALSHKQLFVEAFQSNMRKVAGQYNLTVPA